METCFSAKTSRLTNSATAMLYLTVNSKQCAYRLQNEQGMNANSYDRVKLLTLGESTKAQAAKSNTT